ncbi:hypothetical protein ODV97_13615 [Enterococcus gallinarum]|nr:hypothetical protein [Enterococcus gallinarum]
MDYQSFEGQEAFFNDYQRVAKAGYQEEEVIDDVLEQLNQQLTADQLIYRVEAEKRKTAKSFCFLSANSCIPKIWTQQSRQNFAMMVLLMSMKPMRMNNHNFQQGI